MKASNIYLHPTCMDQPQAVAALERRTQRTALIVRNGRAVQLISQNEIRSLRNDEHPPTAA